MKCLPEHPMSRLSAADTHAPKGRFGGVRVLVVLPVVVGFLVMGGVVNRVLELPRHIVVSLVQELDQAFDLVSGVLAEPPNCLKGLFRGDRGFVVIAGSGVAAGTVARGASFPVRRLSH